MFSLISDESRQVKEALMTRVHGNLNPLVRHNPFISRSHQLLLYLWIRRLWHLVSRNLKQIKTSSLCTASLQTKLDTKYVFCPFSQ